MSHHTLARVLSLGCVTILMACGASKPDPTGSGGAAVTAGSGSSVTASAGSGKGGAGGATTTASVTASGSSTGGASATSSGTGGAASTSASSASAGGATSSTGASSTAASSTSASSASAGGATSSSASAASGSTASASSGGGPTTFVGSCSGAHTALTGVVFAPNGTDPLPNVRVYAASQVNPYPAAYCGKCAAPIDPAYVSTISAADGSFSLNLDDVPASATITFAIQIGRFRKVTTLPVTACQSVVAPAAARTLPGTSAAGDIPKIAVSSGNKDHLDAILSALGITQYDCYEGRKSAGASTATCQQPAGKVIPDVLTDATALGAYHMLFLSCAPGAYAQFATNHDMPLASQNLATWVAAGGRMFATDTAYDYIEQAFPDALTFGGPTAAAGVPQPIDGANIGCSLGTTHPYPAKVDDPLLTQWLKVVGISTSPMVDIEGFIQPWSVLDSIPATTSLIADGSFSMNPTACGTTKDVPLTAQFDVAPCGRVIYSSYHTLSAVNPSGLTAQEKIMEYLIFDAAFCHN